MLALENLPRTCLGNHSRDDQTSESHKKLLYFDTNHSLDEDNVNSEKYDPMATVRVSLHISDYDFIDERHDLPGHRDQPVKITGSIWKTQVTVALLLYEIRHVVSEERIISFDEVTENINSLLNGDIK